MLPQTLPPLAKIALCVLAVIVLLWCPYVAYKELISRIGGYLQDVTGREVREWNSRFGIDDGSDDLRIWG